MSGTEDKDLEKLIERNREKRIYEDSYEPTTSELDDANPPSEDSSSSDTNSNSNSDSE